jgi:tRNA (cmo5U34)-methyltransferase
MMITNNPIQNTSRDEIFKEGLAGVGDFRFDEAVARVFPDMIARSVPGYGTIVSMVSHFAEVFVRDHTRVYDLGCSLGACSLAALKGLQGVDAEIIAVDNSEPMMTRLLGRLEDLAVSLPEVRRIRPLHADVLSVPLNNASLVILNFTLQFIPVAVRNRLIRSIFHGLIPGGALVLSEKLSFSDAQFDQSMIRFHHAFKRANGYSELEISGKRDSLENVLICESRKAHINRMKNAGFKHVDVWFQCFNFSSFLAVKK